MGGEMGGKAGERRRGGKGKDGEGEKLRGVS